jgi:site-specific DNA-methyltransferase (adenine-specific)
MGSGSTVAAAEALRLDCIGVEKYTDYFELAAKAVQPLSIVAVERDQVSFGFSA